MRDLSTVEAVRWLRANEPTLVIVGAGVSMGAPTNAPGVGLFLTETTSVLEDEVGYPPRDRSYLRRLFPESCYGAIGEAFHTNSHLRIWESLSMEVATRLGAEPSVGHRLIVRLAQRDGWPIITTNFDCFLEMAAADLGIDLDVRVPEPWHRKLVVANSASKATLIKLHGSAVDYTTVKSTAADLSRCSIILKRMHIRPQLYRILVIGYSGRDFDLFPWLASTMADCEVLWVDRSFASGEGVAHRAETLPNALTWTGEWNNLAEEVIDAADRPGSARRPDTEIARDYRRTVLDAVRNNIASIAARPGATSVAALIGVFASVGAHRDVAALMARADDVADPDARIQTLLWGAHANSSIDRFHTALMLARQARKLGWRTLSLYSTGRAAIAISYAQVANRWLAVLPGERLSGWDQLRKMLVVLYVPMVTAMYAPLGLWSIIRMTRTRKLPATARYRFAADYLEHLVRLTALLERLRDRVPAAYSTPCGGGSRAAVAESVTRPACSTCPSISLARRRTSTVLRVP